MDFEHATATVGSVRLHYVSAGAGEPLVLLHGWPQTWYEWRRIIPALAAKYRVIAPDMRGLGDSSPRPVDGYDKKTVAADIRRLMQALGYERIFLVGHDWGGPVAYRYAVDFPGEVRKLAVLDVVVPVETPAYPAQMVARLWHLFFHNVPDLPELLVGPNLRAYLSWFYRNGAYNPVAISEEDVDEYVRAYSQPGALRAGFNYYRAVRKDMQDNAQSTAIKLKIPVLALGGERGFGALTIASMQGLAEDVRGGVIERCGHWIPEEQPEVLTNELLKFFGET